MLGRLVNLLILDSTSFTHDGWYKTGDVGLRRDNKFYIVDRKKARYYSQWYRAVTDMKTGAHQI